MYYILLLILGSFNGAFKMAYLWIALSVNPNSAFWALVKVSIEQPTEEHKVVNFTTEIFMSLLNKVTLTL